MKKRSLIFFILAVLVFPAWGVTVLAAGVDLEEIKAAVIDEDFSRVRSLAGTFLEQKNGRKEEQEARYFLGLSRLRLGEYASARQTFEALLQQDLFPGLYDKAALGLIDSLLLTEQYEEALDQLEALERRRTSSASQSLIILKKARACLKLARWDEADRYLKTIVRDFPDSLEAPIARQLLEEERYFAVQVGSFLDRGLAARLVGELKQSGEYAYIVETVDRNGKTFYRVRVGQFTRLEQAMRLEEQLAGRGYPTRIYP